MKYVSTRGAAPVLGFADVLLTGLAPDGGLYVPESVAALPRRCGRSRPIRRVAVDGHVALRRGLDRPRPSSRRWSTTAYATFDHPDVCPVVELGDGLWCSELFHGPTLAFKDVALQLVGRLFDHELTARGRAGHDRGRDVRRHRLGGHRGLRRPGDTSTSSCSTRPVG